MTEGAFEGGVTREKLPSGDYLYGQGSGDETALSAKGWELLKGGVLNLMRNEAGTQDSKKEKRVGQRGFVTKERVETSSGPLDIALKRMPLNPESPKMKGIDQFNAIRALEGAGVLCSEPFLAADDVLITRWESRPQVSSLPEENIRPQFLQYLIKLDQIARQLEAESTGSLGTWRQRWRIDTDPANYAVADLTAEDPLKRFVAIDPVFELYGKEQEIKHSE